MLYVMFFRRLRPIQQASDRLLGQYEKHYVMIPLLINQSNICRNFSLRLSKRLGVSDLAVIELTGVYIYTYKSMGIYQPENLMSNESSRHDDAA
jgi:hypothetical protein